MVRFSLESLDATGAPRVRNAKQRPETGPDPLDARPSRQELLEQHLTTRFGIEVPAFQGWVAEDLQYTGVAHVPSLAWTA